MVIEINPSNVNEQHCLTISVLDDTFYEGEELFGYEIYNQESLDVTIFRSHATVHLQDDDGNYPLIISLLYMRRF